MSGIDFGELLDDYINEAEQLIARMNELVMGLCELHESGTDERSTRNELLSELFRIAHTLKGSSGFVGMRCVEELAHNMETVIDKLRFGGMGLSEEVIEALLQSVDALELAISQLGSGAQLNEALLKSVSECLSRMAVERHEQHVGQTYEGYALPEHVAKVLTEHQEKQAIECLSSGMHLYEIAVPMRMDEFEGEITSLKDALSEFGEVIAVLPQPSQEESYDIACSFFLASHASEDEIASAVSNVGGVVKRLAEAKVSPSEETSTKISVASDHLAKGTLTEPVPERGLSPVVGAIRTIRIDVEKLDKLLNLVGELVVIRSRYATLERQLRERLKGDRLLEELERTNRFLHRRLGELQEGIFEARMIPLRFVFSRAPKLVRELARASGKQVRLTIDGEDVEMDRTIVEAISEPLMHLLRNAVDHGIEPPEERQRAGKEAVGNIHLIARREGGRIIIEVSDDGKGIDVERVAERAASIGIRVSPETLTSQELLEILCQPGLSTSDRVTRISGRGVGLDAVKSSIENLGGMLELETRHGFGTTFRMRLPITVAILQVLLSRVGEALCAFPIEAIKGVLSLRGEHIVTIGGVEAYRVNGDIVPLLRIGELFTRHIARQHKEFVVLAEAYGMRAGIVVNELIGLQEIVVKPLPSLLNRVDILIGAAELGDGSLATILDAQKLVMRLFKYIRASGVKLPRAEAAVGEEAIKWAYVLAFEVGDKVFAMPIEQVAEVLRRCEVLRLPKLPQPVEGTIEWQGRHIPVVDLRKILGIGTPRWDAQTRFIVVSINEMRMAVVVDRVIDIVRIDPNDVCPISGATAVTGVIRCKFGANEVNCILIDLSSHIGLQGYPIMPADS